MLAFKLYHFQGSALKYRFDPYISRVVESGIIEHWINYIKFKLHRNRTFSDQITETREAATLTIDQFQGSFRIFAFGLILATILFFGELIIHKYRAKWQSVVLKFRNRINKPSEQMQRKRFEQSNVCYVKYDRYKRNSTSIINEW